MQTGAFITLQYADMFVPTHWAYPFRLQIFEVLLALAIIDLCNRYRIVIRRNYIFKNAVLDLLDLASCDPLTGVKNRAAAETQVNASILSSISMGFKPAIVMLDIDNFKQINDTYGHQFGDKVLCQLTLICQDQIKDSGTLYRVGGDELLIVITEKSRDEVMNIIGLLKQRIASQIFRTCNKDLVSLTVSIGIAIDPAENGMFRNPKSTFVHFYSLADQAMYEAKRDGRNRINLSVPSL